MVRKSIQIGIWIIIGAAGVSGIILLNNGIDDTYQSQSVHAQSNDVFSPRVPFGGTMTPVCTCTCTGETLVRVDSPSSFRWPGGSETFLFGPYTHKYIDDVPLIPTFEETIGMAVEPKQPCLTGLFCVPCGSGYPILYVGEDGGQSQPTNPTSSNPWTPPF